MKQAAFAWFSASVVLWTGWLNPLPSAQAQDLSPNLRSGAIESSQTPEAGSRIRRGRATGLVDAPIDRVMKVVRDYASYPRFMPNFEITRVLSQRGGAALLFVQVNALHGLTKFWAEVKVKAKDVLPGALEIDARMTKGNLQTFKARWNVTKVSEAQTLVAFELIADPDLPLPIGQGLISDQNEKEARKSIDALRKYLSKAGAPVQAQR